MNINKEQADALRNCAVGSIGYGPHNDRKSMDRELVRHVIRLGLCVVESGVCAGDLAEIADATDGDECPALAAMFDALSNELTKLEASR